MDTPAMLQLLKDPMGVPFFPVVFQALMVLTFTLHILFVNLALGTTCLAVIGRLKGGEAWERLAGGMAKAATASVSGAILLGVAPLLFVQVIYDPFWYASSNLSAAWAIGFIFILMAGYASLYLAREQKGDASSAFAGFSFTMFLLAGFIMHVLGFQLLQPEKWLGWYTSHGAAATAGTVLHDFSLPRFLHFIVPAFAATGALLMLYAWYFRARADMDQAYLAWAGRLGAKMAFHATALEAVTGFLWLLVLPRELRFHAHPLFLLGVVLGLGLLGYLYHAQRQEKDHHRFAWPAALGMFAVVLEMAAAREALRIRYLSRFGYSIADHRLNLDWGSTALFLGTFIPSLVVLAYILAVAYQSGRVAGRWEAGPRMRAWGKASIGILAAWIMIVVGLGITITLRNRGL
ncbi:MAG: hypothetical protein Q8T11_09765 [Elusimicrobiota bacterium]|nr:hypothetical protein [Elusimicrobiota bacterium]